jgi:hypothetical protein
MGHKKPRELDAKDEKSLKKSHYITLIKQVTANFLKLKPITEMSSLPTILIYRMGQAKQIIPAVEPQKMRPSY